MRAITIAMMLAFACLLVALPLASGALIEVDDDGGKDYDSIDEAVTNANSGDRIFVYDGKYYENIEITKRLSIEGQSRFGVVVDGNFTDSVLKFAAGSDGSYLSNMTLMNSSSDSYCSNVGVLSVSDVVLDNLWLNNSALDGILVSEASDVLILDCNVSHSRGDGVSIQDGSKNISIIRTSIFNNTAYGVYNYQTYNLYINSSVFDNNSATQLYTSQGKVWLRNCSFWHEDDSNVTAIYVYEGKVFGINLTYRNLLLSTNTDGYIYLQNYLHVLVERASAPVEGVDIEVTGRSETIYATEGYSGSDPKTDPEGSVQWIVATYAWLDMNGEIRYNGTWTNASFRSWDEHREVSMNESHVETFEYIGSDVLYVDASNAGDPSMDGSEAHPYDTISRAMANATDWAEINVADGTYDEHFDINITVEIIGESLSTVVGNPTVIEVTADDVFLTDIGFESDGDGLRITGARARLDGIDVTATGVGVNADGAEDLEVTDCIIEGDVPLRLRNIDGMTVTGATFRAGTTALDMDNVSHASIDGSAMEDYTDVGILAVDSAFDMDEVTMAPGTAVAGSASIQMVGSSASGTNVTIDPGADLDAELEDSTLTLLNPTFDGSAVSVDAGSILSERYFIHVYVNRTSGEAVEGADLKVTVDGSPVHRTGHYGGSDPQTDADGYVRWIAVESFIYDGSSTPTERNVTVNAYFAQNPEAEWEEVRTLADLNASREEAFTYIPPPINYRPWTNIQVDTDEYSEDVVITFTLGDREGDDCDVTVMYTPDGTTYYNATLTTGGHILNDLSSSKDGKDHQLSWDSYADLPDVDLDRVRLRLIANDTEKEQVNTSGIMLLDNDLDPPTVEVDPLSGELNGQIFIFFNLTDAEENRCHIYAEYDYNGSTSKATLGTGGNTSTSMISSSTGWAYMLHWRSTDDIPGVDDEITFRIIASDGAGDDDNGTADEMTLDIDNNEVPDVKVQASSEEKTGIVILKFDLLDEESDKCTVAISFKRSGDDDFTEASVNLSSITPISSSPTGVRHEVAWDTIADIGTTEDTAIVIKVAVSDADPGLIDSSKSFHVDNDEDPPTIESVTLPDGDIYGDVDVVFVIADEQSAYCSLYIKYRIGEQSVKSVEFDSPWGSGNPLTGLETSPEGEEYNFTWHTVDNLGKVKVEDIVLILEPYDGPQVPDQGEVFETDPFVIRNDYYLPHIVSLDVTGYREDIAIDYTLADLEEDEAELKVQYSIDAGENWEAATMGEGGDGKEDLATSEEGIAHVFIWDSYADLPDVNYDDILLRLQPFNSGETGPWNVTEPFDLRNVLNELPEMEAFAAEQDHGNITLSCSVRDADDTTVDISLQYKLSISFQAATAKGDLGNVTVSNSWKTVTLTWDSIADLGYNDHTVTLRLKVNDGTSEVMNEATILLKNGQIPLVAIEDVRTGAGQGVPEGIAIADIVLKDFQSDDCDLDVEYSEDMGSLWTTATIDEEEGEPTSGLFSSSSGTDHSIAWDSLEDLGSGVFVDVLLRIRADDGDYVGPWATTDPFSVDNGEQVNQEPEGIVIPIGQVNKSEPMTIRVRVEDDSDDIEVRLFFRKKGDASYSEEEMETEDGINFTYTIQAEDIGSAKEIEYYVEIDDGEFTFNIGTEGTPRIATVDQGPGTSSGGGDEADMMPLILIIVVAGAGGGAAFFVMKKKGKKGATEGAQAAPGQHPPGAHPPQHPGAQGANYPGAYGGAQAGAVTSVCPVCGAPVLVPPQRPVNVTCSRCRNTFHVQ
ncbi:MAG: right-handed parallel beta-helix repeat-containing protein [Thermoplasmata archaeon]|nr:right-handed parallel beta-helix repeat-containing protein [Thermoplasmata archaeon]